MSVGEKVVNTAGGAARDGLGWGLKGVLGVAALGAAIGALVVAWPLAVYAGTGWAIFGGGIAALVGAIGGVAVGGPTVGSTAAALGVLKGGVSGFLTPSSTKPSLDQQLAVEQQKFVSLQQQLAERQRAASGYDNPNVTTDHTVKAQAAAAAQAQNVTAL